MEPSRCKYSDLVNAVNGEVETLCEISEDGCFSLFVSRSIAW